ncbi:MAG: glutamate--tRNA ligase [Elusimicrobiales bacterium]|nr:glutamate--tRNA ligase [Elusimicrobiales bacterium]
MSEKKIRVRFAPSPTGYLHIGGARTALFNYLFAKKYNGVFILRIEDTDELRSTKESMHSIFESLKWLGLSWDEGAIDEEREIGDFGPYIQSKREALGIYKKYAEELLKKGMAYYCYCTPKELEEMRLKAHLEKRPPKYDGRCRHLTQQQIKNFELEGRKPVIRFKMPDDGITSWNDLIHGELKFENKLLYDFIMIKASGYPTYNFACVVDDHLMDITHVIRGDDHISNTPLQINIYKAFGWELPNFAHLSMILGPDGTRLSKRHGATSISEYRKLGYLPHTMKNYLALLGWSTKDSQQIFEKGELEEKFDLEGCQKNPAIFDPVKLTWMNGEYIRKMTKDELYEASLPFLKEAGIDLSKASSNVADIVAIEQEKYKLLSDIPKLIDFFFTDEITYDEISVEKVLKKPGVRNILSEIKEVYEKIEIFTEVNIENATRQFCKEKGYKTSEVFHPVRVAVSGRSHGPTLFKMLEYIGKRRVLVRLEKSISFFLS